MPLLNRYNGALFSGAVAALVYTGSVGHGWAVDDGQIIESNSASHSIPNAMGAFFDSYWPNEEAGAGQYRPLTILSFAIDWTVSSGDPRWFHLVNLLLHATTTALFVLVASAWLTPVGSLTAGLVWAVHPVHVEAVANVVGRAEVLVAAGMFASILAVRAFHRQANAFDRRSWFGAVTLFLIAALLTKEHAVVIVAVLAFDQLLGGAPRWRTSTNLYICLVAVTAAWFYLWMGVAGAYVEASAAATIRGLSIADRLATMAVAQTHVVRLLVWPSDLAADYSPQVIPRLTALSWASMIGFITSMGILGIAVVAWRKAPAVTFGIGLGVMSYAPTANLLFPSGVVLSERNLYVAVAAPALLMGWLIHETATGGVIRGRTLRFAISGTVGALLVLGTIRTITRIPFWNDDNTVVINDFAEHPENYRAHLRVGSLLRANGDLPGALAEAVTAGAIFEHDPWTAQFSVVRALDLGQPRLALREALRAYALEPEHPSFARLVVRSRLALNQPDSADVVARQSVIDAPFSPVAMWSHLEVLDSLRSPPWQKYIARAKADFVEARLVSASARIDSALNEMTHVTLDGENCWHVVTALPMIEALRPDVLLDSESVVGAFRDGCAIAAPEASG